MLCLAGITPAMMMAIVLQSTLILLMLIIFLILGGVELHAEIMLHPAECM